MRPSGEEPRRGASPAALGGLMNRVNNLLRGQASSALSVSGAVRSSCCLFGWMHLLVWRGVDVRVLDGGCFLYPCRAPCSERC